MTVITILSYVNVINKTLLKNNTNNITQSLENYLKIDVDAKTVRTLTQCVSVVKCLPLNLKSKVSF